MDQLALRACERSEPGPGQVEIDVAAAGLNFSDVMKALGLYPGLPDGPVPLGIECAGRIERVGQGVSEFQPGDEVVAVTPFSFGTHALAERAFVVPKPDHITFEQAATLPIAFLTAHYALNHMGRLAKGERVLVHSATGGVGLAAIQLAWEAGAEVFATAGTSEKRDLLRSLGIQHVMDSRSLDFADEVLEATAARASTWC
jgi:NADPH:quinone reductase-like Zn-dependent oxidoreductase